MNIGDKLMLVPSTASSTEDEETAAIPCRVVYIHPERRFYRVEFKSTITGETWRETFYFADRRAADYKDSSAPRLPGSRK